MWGFRWKMKKTICLTKGVAMKKIYLLFVLSALITNLLSASNKQLTISTKDTLKQAMEKLKIIPKGVAAKVKRKAKINVEKIHKIESKVHHDVVAFLTSIAEKVGSDAKFLHKGMTSSDVLDTCFNIQLIQASKIINKDIEQIFTK